MPQLPPFLLQDAQGGRHSFPSGRPALIGFVKEDCPTCDAVMPLLEGLYAALGSAVDFFVAGQTAAGNQLLTARHGLTLPLLDDSSLKVSFAYDVEVVPTLCVVGADGQLQERLVGLARDEWRRALEGLAVAAEAGPLALDWESYPQWRPGCGSRSVDPAVADRLRAQAENSPLRARRIEVGDADDAFELMYDLGFSDGLPLVPPTPERVLRMLECTGRDAQEVVAVVPPNMGEATVEKVAINAVLAGCRPEYLPVVIAGLQAVCTDDFNIHGVMATTMGASPVLVVNGPVRHQLGMNMQLGVLGQGNRANASIGRALRLAIRNLGGAVPGGTERSTFGNPMKFTMCFPEWEERSPWPPLHVERGFAPEDSVVTAFAMSSGPVLMVDQDARSGVHLAGSFGLCLESALHPRAHFATEALVVVSPEHVDTFVRDDYGKAEIRARIQEVSARPIGELVADEVSAVGLKQAAAAAMDAAALARQLPKFRRAEDIHIVVAGAEAGKFSAAFHGWVTGEVGSIPVSQKMED